MVVMSEDEIRGRYHRILSWEDDWDGEGSPALSFEVLEQAVRWRESIKQDLGHDFLDDLTMGPYGTVDMDAHFDDGYELLINFPHGGPITFYGDDGNYLDRVNYPDFANTEEAHDALIVWLKERPTYEPR